ncbi:hypothetical protein COLO4_06843 [Corchorus olitorius]|uniref:Uncharacterized protein n=1 Tax=Corchorus olitorius TaxID=93759 RepID=A0A1R3KLY9_9ROSI|nr:hypothetical protein COLO4_06843 [Corchorus olitorius]
MEKKLRKEMRLNACSGFSAPSSCLTIFDFLGQLAGYPHTYLVNCHVWVSIGSVEFLGS